MGLSQQEYWSGLPFLPSGDLPDPHHLHCRQILYNCATRDTICIKTYTYTHITKTKPPNKSVAFRSVAQPCPTHYDPMVCSVPGFTVHHQILELAQTNGQQVCDVIQPSHPLSSPYPPVFNLSQQTMSQFLMSGGQSIGASASASVLPMNIQDWFPLGLTGLFSLPSKGLSRVFFKTTVQKHQFLSTQLSL